MAIPSSQVPDLVEKSSLLGYSSVFLITSELLLAENWQEIINSTGDTYVNTNGKIIASKGKSILEDMEKSGIEQIVITANIPGYHSGLDLTDEDLVQKAFQNIHNYKSKQFNTIATVIVTSENYSHLSEMADYVKNVYKADGVKFISYLPLPPNGITELSPTLEQLEEAIDLISELREKYDVEEFAIQRSGTFGSQGLSDSKKKQFCPAGDSLVTIISQEEGTPVTPCIFISDVEIGNIQEGVPIIDGDQLDSFLQLKEQAIQDGYCPAHYISTVKNEKGFVPDLVQIKIPEVKNEI